MHSSSGVYWLRLGSGLGRRKTADPTLVVARLSDHSGVSNPIQTSKTAICHLLFANGGFVVNSVGLAMDN